MSLARATVLARCRPTLTFARHRRRNHDDHHEEAVEYPQERISSAFWRNSILLSLAVIGFWKYAPAPDDGVYLTRWIAMYGTPAEEWARINTKLLLLSQDDSETMRVVSDARKPPMYRYRYPERFEVYSAHRVPVGSTVDMTDLKVKDTQL